MTKARKVKGQKIILDLCGGTGAWSRPYKDAGYDVRLITLPEWDVADYTPHEPIHGILAAPPCTEFSLAKNDKPRDFNKGMIAVQHCLRIIWTARKYNDLKWWALENPRCFLRQFIGKPAFTFEQWQFGDNGIKPTDLWGYFKEPHHSKLERPGGMTTKYPNGRHNAKGWSKSAEKRAITPPGFAKAFFEANP